MPYGLTTKIGPFLDFTPQVISAVGFTTYASGPKYRLFLNDYNAKVKTITSLADLLAIYVLTFEQLRDQYGYTSSDEFKNYLASIMSPSDFIGNLQNKDYSVAAPEVFYRNLNQERYSFTIYPGVNTKIKYNPVNVWLAAPSNTSFNQEASTIATILWNEFGKNNLIQNGNLFLNDLYTVLLMSNIFTNDPDKEEERSAAVLNFSKFQDKLNFYLNNVVRS